MNILRKEAVRLAALTQIFKLSEEERNERIENALIEFGLENVSEAKEHFYLRKYLEIELNQVKNSYLEMIISKNLQVAVKIKGNQPRLYPCPCCSYKALKERGGYEICDVCFWEDDGGSIEEEYSYPNKMLLKEAKKNFETFEACDQGALRFLKKDRMLMYDK